MINRISNIFIIIAAIILITVSIMAPNDGDASEFRIKPALILSEEYNDNVLLTTTNRYDDYIMETDPSILISYTASNWDWDVAYNYYYRYFTYGSLDNDSSHSLNLMNKNRIITDVFFLDVKDQYTRVSLDVMRDYTQESNYVNQSDRNLLTINPYFVLKPLSRMTVTTGYLYLDTWYKDSLAINRKDHIGYADVKQDISPRSAIVAGASHTLDTTSIGNYTQDDLYLGQYYEYAANSSITVRAGYSWFDFESAGRTTQVFWEANVTQRYPTISVIYETGVRYITDPLRSLRKEDRYLVTIRKDIMRSSLKVSGGLLEYREADSKNYETTTYQLNCALIHGLTTNAKIMIDLAADRYKDSQTSDMTDRYISGVRIELMTMENLMLSMDYHYTNVYSPHLYLVNYYNNRYNVQLRKFF